MDLLIDKGYKKYDKRSRYSTVPIYYHKIDNKWVHGVVNLPNRNTEYSNYVVKKGDTLDTIALDFYGNPTYFWVIAEFNRINDPFLPLRAGIKIRIPSLSEFTYEV